MLVDGQELSVIAIVLKRTHAWSILGIVCEVDEAVPELSRQTLSVILFLAPFLHVPVFPQLDSQSLTLCRCSLDSLAVW